jgi:hypothetical protein
MLLTDLKIENLVSENTTDSFATLSTSQELPRPSGVSLAPVRASIEYMNPKSPSPYLESPDSTPVTSVPADASTTTTQAKAIHTHASFSPVRSSIKNVDSTASTPYLDALKGHTMPPDGREGSFVSIPSRTINTFDSNPLSQQSADLHQHCLNEKQERRSTDHSSTINETSVPRSVVSSNLSGFRPTPASEDFRESSILDNKENNQPASQDLQIWLNEARKHAPLLQAGPDKPDLKNSVRMMSSPIASPYLDKLISSPRQESPKPQGSSIVHKTSRWSPRNGGGPDAADLKHKVLMSSSSSNPYLDSLRQE